MTATELIKELQKLIERYGDKEIYSGGEDYPGPVVKIQYIVSGSQRAYLPDDTFDIQCRNY